MNASSTVNAQANDLARFNMPASEAVGFNMPARETARFNMIEQQIRTWEVLDPVVLDLLGLVPRETFVAEAYQGLAFADIELPIGHGQTMLSPKLEGRILQALNIQKTDKVLEIGTGCGYFTALLASLAAEVVSVEINPELSQLAAKNLAQLKLTNITLEVGDAATGWDKQAPYNVIVYTGSLPIEHAGLRKNLAIGGNLFVVLGEAPVMQATLIRRVSETGYQQDVLFETCLPELMNAKQPPRFEF